MSPWRRAPRHFSRCSEKRLLLYLTAFFLATRLAFFAAGVRFDPTPLFGYWQNLDPRLLEDDLLRSLFYLHSQPPLWNLFLGWVLQLSPVAPDRAFAALFTAAGLVCYLATFALARLLGVSRGVAFLAATVLVVRPSFILFESWLTYDVPVTALLSVAAVSLAGFLIHRRPGGAWAFFAALGLLCATRSLFHLIYFVAAVALTAAWAADRRRLVVKAAALPLALLAFLYLKNLALFGHPGPSSWLGMSLARIATAALTDDELRRLHDDGKISVTATIEPFSPLDRYPAEYFKLRWYPEIDALTQREKSTGSVNYNHEAYVRISNTYLKDALWIVCHRPGVYLGGVARAWYNYFKPQTHIDHVSVNAGRIGGYAALGERLLYGRLPFGPVVGGQEKPIYLFSTLGLPLLALWALSVAVSGREPAAARQILAFCVLTLVYVAFVGNSLEVWENQRFRFYTDPFSAVILALLVDRTLRRGWPRRARDAPAHSVPSNR